MTNKTASAVGTEIRYTTNTLLVLFIIFKLTGDIDWSWWWIFSPFWIPAVVTLLGWVILRAMGVAVWKSLCKKKADGTLTDSERKFVADVVAKIREMKQKEEQNERMY